MLNPIQSQCEPEFTQLLPSQNTSRFEDYSTLEELIPFTSTLIGVTSLVEAFQGLQSRRLKASLLSQRFRKERKFDFISTLKAAEMLGLVEMTNECILLTDLGIGFLLASDGKIRIFRSRLSGIEPFKTALELLSKKKSILVRDIVGSLNAKYPSLGVLSGITEEEKIRNGLIEWGISSELITYNGKTRSFHLASKTG